MTGWREFGRELDFWGEAGRQATFWWRDDDAVEDTPALARLLELRARLDVPMAVAVIPARADDSLARSLARDPRAEILQHGWAHQSYAPDPRAKSELGRDRPVAAVMDDLAVGRGRLDTLFGEGWHPIVVPPWNRIDPAVVAALPDAGYLGVSTMGARPSRDAAPGLWRVNVHLDPIEWRTTRGFAGDDTVLAAALDHLCRRRAGTADADEPTGLMTHHLAHDDGCWAFIEQFLAVTTTHPAARWIGARRAFGLDR